jgi:ankyrin repeat protein
VTHLVNYKKFWKVIMKRKLEADFVNYNADDIEEFSSDSSDESSSGENIAYDDIFEAIEAGDLYAVGYFIKNGINHQYRNGKAPLDVAVESGNLKIVKLLVEEGVNVCNKKSILKDAARNTEILQFLIQAGLKADYSDLIFAASNGLLESSIFIVNSGVPVDGNLGKDGGHTALCAASYYGHIEIMQFFLQIGADRDIHDVWGFGPLHLAAQSGAVNSLRFWIEEVGVGVDDTYDEGDDTALQIALEKGQVESAKYLIDKGASFTKEGREGCTALEYALAGKSLDILQLLKNENKITINDVAKSILNEELDYWAGGIDVGAIKFLIRWGFPVNSANEDGKTVLHYVFGGHCSTNDTYNADVISLLEELEEEGRKVFRVEDSGDTILHLACKYRNLDIVKYLVEKQEVDVTVKNKVGDTPLHVVCKRLYDKDGFAFNDSDCLEIVKCLINNIDENIEVLDVINTKNKEGRTALQVTPEDSNDIRDFLIGLGAEQFPSLRSLAYNAVKRSFASKALEEKQERQI